MTEKDYCDGCGGELSDCGPIGYACINEGCTYERDMVIAIIKAKRKAEELKELARLKAKYENEE